MTDGSEEDEDEEEEEEESEEASGSDEDESGVDSEEDDDSGPDLARGKGNIETSSDEDEDEDDEDYVDAILRKEEEEIEHDWGELCKDAPRGDEVRFEARWADSPSLREGKHLKTRYLVCGPSRSPPDWPSATWTGTGSKPKTCWRC